MFKKISNYFTKGAGHLEKLAEGRTTRMEQKDLQEHMKDLNLKEWKFDQEANRLSRRLSTKGYQNTSDFVQAVKGVAERMGITPDIKNGVDYLDLSLSGKDANGVGQGHVGLASAIDRLEKSYQTYIKEGLKKPDYKLELNEKDEEDIYNSLTRARKNEGKGYGQSSGYAQAGQESRDNQTKSGQDSQTRSGQDGKDNKSKTGQDSKDGQSKSGQSLRGGRQEQDKEDQQGERAEVSNKDKNNTRTAADGYNFNKNRAPESTGEDSLSNASKTQQTDPSKFGTDSHNNPRSTFGRYGNKDSTMQEDDVSPHIGQGSYDTLGQSRTDTTTRDSSDKSNQSSAYTMGQNDKEKGYQGSVAPGPNQQQVFQQGSSTSPADNIANRQYEKSMKTSLKAQGISTHIDAQKTGDYSEQNNQARDSTARFYEGMAKSTYMDHQQVNNTSYRANQDSANANIRNNAQESAQESNYGKGSRTDQGVWDKDKVGSDYPTTNKTEAPRDSDYDKGQVNREEMSKVNARQNQSQDDPTAAKTRQVQDDSNLKKDNNDSNEFPNPRDRQDGVRNASLKDAKGTQTEPRENTKSSAAQKKEQDGFIGNNPKVQQIHEKSYK